jgi:hypothetical protein
MADGKTRHNIPPQIGERSIRSIEETYANEPENFDEAEEEALRQEAMRISPSRAELESLIERLRPSSINYDEEDPELPC